MALGIYIRCDPDKPSSLLKLAINVQLNSQATVSLYQIAIVILAVRKKKNNLRQSKHFCSQFVKR